MRGIRFQVVGRVQGVGFRAWVARVARKEGLSGAVRNRLDGSVEVDAAGTDASIDVLRRALQSGPPQAIVSRVHEMPIDVNDAAFLVDR